MKKINNSKKFILLSAMLGCFFQASAIDTKLVGFASSSGKYMLVSADGDSFYSSNLTNNSWKKIPNSTQIERITAIAGMNGVRQTSPTFLAVTDAGMDYVSYNNQSWQPRSAIKSSSTINDIINIQDKNWLAVGTDGAFFSNSDGATWQKVRTNNAPTLNSIASYLDDNSDDIYVVAGNNGYVGVDSDPSGYAAINFRELNTGTRLDFSKTVAVKDGFIVLGHDNKAAASFYFKNDHTAPENIGLQPRQISGLPLTSGNYKAAYDKQNMIAVATIDTDQNNIYVLDLSSLDNPNLRWEKTHLTKVNNATLTNIYSYIDSEYGYSEFIILDNQGGYYLVNYNDQRKTFTSSHFIINS